MLEKNPGKNHGGVLVGIPVEISARILKGFSVEFYRNLWWISGEISCAVQRKISGKIPIGISGGSPRGISGNLSDKYAGEIASTIP